METQRSPPPKSTTHTMVCSRHPWLCHTWPTFIFNVWNYTSKLCCPVCPQTQDPHPSKETWHRTKDQHDLTHLQKAQYLSQKHTDSRDRQPPLPPLNSKDDLIRTYPDHLEGIGWFSETCHITLIDDAKDVIHAPRKCPIAMQSMVCDKIGEFINQGVIVPVMETTDSLSSLT